ncbi:D-beta-hydroxybutyrate dehydrogenase, mitochondrial isoform X2 [Athalia rosae]|uniref:D-beta-hydroxybutyrate dehydrogenase, mitochondrial isoform X2 n=1 Tax=Athalia rosae TaxID=37344 RepID=UPI002033D339|nr:D-beta-hydroxybutyrate dehydrogenase, mitochondrial isoform X2 [Athalia rosae]
MDPTTGAMLALQILALCSIVAALLAYLVRQSRNASNEFDVRSKRYVLVTSCDNSVGLQIAIALAEAGYKVFAGLLEPEGSSPSAKIIRALDDQRKKEPALTEITEDAADTLSQGQIVPLELDTTREDSLHACLDAVRSRLPAGLWAVVHTGGLALAGTIERQESSAWECMLRHNLVAPLRTARAFIPLLRAKRGRIVLLGDSEASFSRASGLVAYSASRRGVEGAAEALRSELLPSGVAVVLLKPPPVNPLVLYGPPILKRIDVEIGVDGADGTWTAPLPTKAIRHSLIPALGSPCPISMYNMASKARNFCAFNSD